MSRREPCRIMIIGAGVLGGDVLDFLSQRHEGYRLFIGARDQNKLNLRVNLARYTAMNLGYQVDIEALTVDVMNIARTAETIAAVRPDIVFNATTLQSWWDITRLPPEIYQRIDRARGGVWTPMHLVLTRRLMQAVRQSGSNAIVVNASYPDVVNAALAGEGLAPAIGIGNISNAVPGIRLAAADLLGCDVDEVQIRFFAQHYLSYRMPSTGETDGAPYHLSIYRKGQKIADEQVDHKKIFSRVAGKFRRVKGLAGQSVTASSATAVLTALAKREECVVHAPGPLGLVGGYPVKINPSSISVALPQGLSLETAVKLNEDCQKFDGIESVDADGGVRFTTASATIIREELGYDCDYLPLAECEDRAEELGRRYAEFRRRHLTARQ